MTEKQAAIVMGSTSDRDVAEKAYNTLKELGVMSEVRVMSAHRTPDELAKWAASAEENGIKVIIAVAGMSAALPGSVAAHTTVPVLGVPVESGSLDGMDALLSISQMPPGIPVGCLAVGKAGAKNAAIMAAEILALSDEKIRKAVKDFRKAMKEIVIQSDKDFAVD